MASISTLTQRDDILRPCRPITHIQDIHTVKSEDSVPLFGQLAYALMNNWRTLNIRTPTPEKVHIQWFAYTVNLHILLCVRVRSFKTSKNDHIIEVQLYDDIDFICPYYPTESSTSAASEFYTIYMVGISVCNDIFSYVVVYHYLLALELSLGVKRVLCIIKDFWSELG